MCCRHPSTFAVAISLENLQSQLQEKVVLKFSLWCFSEKGRPCRRRLKWAAEQAEVTWLLHFTPEIITVMLLYESVLRRCIFWIFTKALEVSHDPDAWASVLIKFSAMLKFIPVSWVFLLTSKSIIVLIYSWRSLEYLYFVAYLIAMKWLREDTVFLCITWLSMSQPSSCHSFWSEKKFIRISYLVMSFL